MKMKRINELPGSVELPSTTIDLGNQEAIAVLLKGYVTKYVTALPLLLIELTPASDRHSSSVGAARAWRWLKSGACNRRYLPLWSRVA
jgi:hypothetical protein